jgi:hypothetical protein
MINRCAAGALVLTLCVTADACAASWSKFTSKLGRFSVSTPAPLAYQRKVAQTPEGQQELHLFATTLGSTLYRVAYVDYAKRLDRPDMYLNGAALGVVSSMGAMLKSQTPVRVKGYPARDLVASLPDGKPCRMRLVLVKQRLFQVMVCRVSGTLSAEDLRFLGSFTLVK